MGKNSKKTSRRQFLRGGLGAAAAFTIVPRHVLGVGVTPPSEKLNIACIGGGKSLARKVLTDYGNDVINWEANEPTPGAGNP